MAGALDGKRAEAQRMCQLSKWVGYGSATKMLRERLNAEALVAV